MLFGIGVFLCYCFGCGMGFLIGDGCFGCVVVWRWS